MWVSSRNSAPTSSSKEHDRSLIDGFKYNAACLPPGCPSHLSSTQVTSAIPFVRSQPLSPLNDLFFPLLLHVAEKTLPQPACLCRTECATSVPELPALEQLVCVFTLIQTLGLH